MPPPIPPETEVPSEKLEMAYGSSFFPLDDEDLDVMREELQRREAQRRERSGGSDGR